MPYLIWPLIEERHPDFVGRAELIRLVVQRTVLANIADVVRQGSARIHPVLLPSLQCGVVDIEALALAGRPRHEPVLLNHATIQLLLNHTGRPGPDRPSRRSRRLHVPLPNPEIKGAEIRIASARMGVGLHPALKRLETRLPTQRLQVGHLQDRGIGKACGRQSLQSRQGLLDLARASFGAREAKAHLVLRLIALKVGTRQRGGPVRCGQHR